MKKILFISYDGMTDPLGQSQVIPYLAGLTKFGYTFTILSCDKPERYHTHRQYVEGLLNGLPIEWVSIPYHKNPPVLSSMYDYYRLRNKAKTLHASHKFDMVHTRPGIPTLVALWMKKKYGLLFYNDVRGFWADERVDGGMWKLENPVYKKIYQFFKQHEYECLEKADAISCLTNAAKKEMLSWTTIKAQPLNIDVIPCSADLSLFNPGNINAADKERFRTQLGIRESDFIISYLGSIGGWYLTSEMMQFCKMLSAAIPAAKFLFISPHRHQHIVAAAAKEGLPADKLITIQAQRHEVPVLLSFSSWSLFFIKPCYSKLSSSPTKHGEIMAMGIPVITNAGVGDVKEIVNSNQAGIVLEDLSLQSMQKAVQQVIHTQIIDREKIKQAAAAFYSLEHAVQQYRNRYDQVFNATASSKQV